jgi:putative transcriptional regulator
MHGFKIHKATNIEPSAGKLLIAEPFMPDPEFRRAVVLICNHDENGTFGLSINNSIDQTLDEFLPAMTKTKWPVYIGGPVDTDTLFVIHSSPDVIGGEFVCEGIYLGADFQLLKMALENNLLSKNQVKFFIGCSGWSAGQLENELKEEAWLVAPADNQIVLSNNKNEIYKKSLERLGKSFAIIAMLPIHPSLN